MSAAGDRPGSHALVVCGAYGTGKTSLVEEMADMLEESGVRYAAIDMDWLGWYDTGEPDHDAGWPVLLRNLDAVVSNYHAEGVRRFLLAGTIGGARDLAELRAVLRMPVATVRLIVPIEEIERRLGAAVATGRAHDLEVARDQVANEEGLEIGDLVLANDRPIKEIATEVLAWFRLVAPERLDGNGAHSQS